MLHCPEDEGHVFQPAGNSKYVEWLNTFCKINVVPEKICTALISVTKEQAVSICSEHDENLKTDFSGTSLKHMKVGFTWRLNFLFYNQPDFKFSSKIGIF